MQKRILEELKEDCRTSSKELAKKLNFSTAAIVANLHELEKSGVIQKFTVRLNLEKMDVGQIFGICGFTYLYQHIRPTTQ